MAASVVFGDLHISDGVAMWAGSRLSITQTECVMLRELARVAPRPLGRDDLCIRAFGNRLGSQRVDVHISHLRRKLTPTALAIPGSRCSGGYALIVNGPKVLVAENRLETAAGIDRILRTRLNAQVRVARTYEVARRNLVAEEWHLLIADTDLPPERSIATSPLGMRLVKLVLVKSRAKVIVVSDGPAFASDACDWNVPFLMKPFSYSALCSLAYGTLTMAS